MPRVMFIDLLADIYDLHGVYSLSAVMKHHGIEVYFARERHFKKALSRIAGVKPDLLLYSAMSPNLYKYLEFDKLVKSTLGVRSLIGGPGPTFAPTCINASTIDAACIGEGETALVDFIHSGYKPQKNVFLRGAVVPTQFYSLIDPDKLPFPDRGLVYDMDPVVRDMPSKQFISGRGCPYQCTYCFNHEFNRMFEGCGPVVRKKSVSYLLEEINLVRRQYPLTNVAFNDDTFIVNKKWFYEFAERFPRETGLTYTCNVRANLVDDDIARALNQSRCVAVNWSIESGCDHIRNDILKRGMSRKNILDTAQALTRHKIPYRIGNIIGLPGEKFEQMLETLELNIEARPSLGLAAIFTPFPGLEITGYAIDQGYYVPSDKKHLPKNMFSRSMLSISLPENRLIQKLAYLFPIFVKFPWLYRNRDLRRFLLDRPVTILRIKYHLFNTFMMMRMYRVRSSWFHRLRLAIRYVGMLFS